MITLAHQAIVATVGLPGSGKSTWADCQVHGDQTGLLTIVNRDHIRAMTRKPYPTAEHLVTAIQEAAIVAALDEGYSVIIDDTNLNPAHLSYWQKLADRRLNPCMFLTVESFLHTPLQEILRRNTVRPTAEQLPEDAILNLHAQWSHVWPQIPNALREADIPTETVRIGYDWDPA